MKVEEGPFRLTIVDLEGKPKTKIIKLWKNAYREFEESKKNSLFAIIFEISEDMNYRTIKEKFVL